MPEDPAELLRRESRSLVQRLRSWTAVRYAAAAPPHGSRGDLVHSLVQALAALAADVEGRPPRAVPRLDTDLALADQLAVVSDDLVRSRPPEQVAREATQRLLLARGELLGEEVPQELARALQLGDRRSLEPPTAGPP